MADFNTEKIEIVGKPVRKRKMRGENFLSGPGLIVGGIRAFSAAVSRVFRRGLTARIIDGYGKADERLKNSATSRAVRKIRKKPAVKNLRLRIAGAIERSMCARMADRLYGAALRLRSRQLGAFLLSFGGYTAVVYFLKKFAGYSMTSAVDPVCGAVIAAAGFPLMFSGRTVVSLARDSGLFGTGATVRDGNTDEDEISEKSAASLTPALVSGILCGLATLKLSAPAVLGIIAVAAAVIVLFRIPETGIPLIIVMTPFASVFPNPSFFLGCTVAVTAVAFALKLLLGKRSAVFGASDVPFVLLWFCVLLSALPGRFPGAHESAFMSALLMLSCMLSVCLVRTRKSLEASSAAMVIASSAVAFIGIVQFILGLAPSGWTDISLFPGIHGRVTSVFPNPNMLGAYLVTAFPFTLYSASGKNRYVSPAAGVIASAAVAVCAVLTWSRTAWIGMAAGTVIFIGSCGFGKLFWLVPAGGAVCLGGMIFSDTLGRRLRFFSSLADSANYYRKAIWDGAIGLLKQTGCSGIGAGDLAFSAFYIGHSMPGIEGAVHSHSLYLQIAVQTGLIGLILFAVTVLSGWRKAAFAGLRTADRRSSLCVAAALASVAGMCVSGVFDYVFYNYRVMCSFWTVFGLLSAAADICRGGSADIAAPVESDPSAAEIEIRISGPM